MNILEANSILLSHFIQNDSINNEYFNKFVTKKQSLSEVEAAMSYALAELETKGIVSKFTGVNANNALLFTWVLKQPLVFNNQSVKIGGDMGFTIANIVNSFYESIGGDGSCNPLEITEEDLSVLTQMIEMYAEKDINNKKDSIKDEQQN